MSRLLNSLSFINFILALISVISCFDFVGIWPLVFGFLLFGINAYEIMTSETPESLMNNTAIINTLSIFLTIWKLYF